MQSLATANLVDLLLQTRIPTSRLVDWIDQSLLLLHARGVEQGLAPKLRQLGIRTATDLLALFPTEAMDDSRSEETATKPILDALAELGLDAKTVRNLSRVLAREPNLEPVRNWKERRPVHPAGSGHSATTPTPASGAT